jgi:hypothetical protein
MIFVVIISTRAVAVVAMNSVAFTAMTTIGIYAGSSSEATSVVIVGARYIARCAGSGEHGNQKKMRPTWNALYAANAEVVVSGHDHSYERFAPQKPDGSRDAVRGIREFVVGTGGGEHYPFATIKPNSQVRNAKTFGVLRLTLSSGTYTWKFVPVAGKTFTDSGTTSCH